MHYVGFRILNHSLPSTGIVPHTHRRRRESEGEKERDLKKKNKTGSDREKIRCNGSFSKGVQQPGLGQGKNPEAGNTIQVLCKGTGNLGHHLLFLWNLDCEQSRWDTDMRYQHDLNLNS